MGILCGKIVFLSWKLTLSNSVIVLLISVVVSVEINDYKNLFLLRLNEMERNQFNKI